MYGEPKWGEIDRYLAKTFADEDINQLINKAHVSCWTSDSNERHFMWELYGKRSAAVRIRVNEDRIYYRFKEYGGRNYGEVTYGFQPSRTRPQFIGSSDGGKPLAERRHHLFFHKHHFYILEKEYRFVVFDPDDDQFYLPCKDLITEVRLSPFHKWTKDEREKTEAFFGKDLIRSSELKIHRENG